MARAPSAEWYHDRPAGEPAEYPGVVFNPQAATFFSRCDLSCHATLVVWPQSTATDREAAMGSEAIWSAEAERIQRVMPVVRGGRATTARWGARLCLACGERRPLFFYRGVVKADRDHNLCFECYRAEVNRLRARRLDGRGRRRRSMANPHPRPSKAVADRAALLADIAIRRRRAQIMRPARTRRAERRRRRGRAS